MEKQSLGTPNNKAIYHRFGIIAEVANNEMKNSGFSNSTALTQIKALNGQIKVFDSEIKLANVKIKKEECKRKTGATIEIRNVESKTFDEIPL
jgi:hypothetical protein